MLHSISNIRPVISYYCTIEVTPKGTFPLGTMLTVSNMKDLLPTVSTQECDASTTTTTTTTDHPQDAVLNMDVVVDFSGYIVGGDATDELMEVCALSMRNALQSQLDLSIINGHHLHSCHVVYKCIHFRDCGLFQYPMQRVVEGLLGVVPEVLFDVLVPAPTPAQTNADVSGEEEVAATESSNSVIPSPHQQQRCILNVSCESLDFGVNLFHTEYLTAFADELAWVVGSTSRLSREGNTALLDLAHCAIGLNYCTEITPSNVCQIVGTCLRAQATPSEDQQAAAAHYPFSIDVSGGTMVPLMPTTTTTKSNNNGGDDDVDGSALNASDTLLSSSPKTLRRSSFKLVVLSPKDGCVAMDGAAADMEEHAQTTSSSSPTTTTTSQCWRLQLLETLEYELLYLVGDGLLPSDGSNLPSVALDGFLDFPEGYTLQHNRNNNNNNNDNTDNDDDEEAGMRLLEFNADDGGASLRAILSSFAAEFPAACKCIRVPITAQRAAAAATGVVVVGTVHDEVTKEDMRLSSSASPHRHDRKPLKETTMTTDDAILPPCSNQPSLSSPSAAPSDATLKWCSLEDVVHIVTAEVAHINEQQQQHDDDEDVLGDTISKGDASLVSVSSASDYQHTSPDQHRRLDQLVDDVDRQCDGSVGSVEEADEPVPDCDDRSESFAEKSAILAASTSSVADHHHHHHTPHTSTIPSKHLSPVDHSRLIPPSRRRLAHAAHSLADTENGLGACIDSCLHTTTTSPSRSTVGPCRGGGGAASRSVSPPQHLVSSAVVAPTSPSSRSLSPSRTAMDTVITTVAPVAIVTQLSEGLTLRSSPPSQSSGQVVDDMHAKMEEDDTTSCDGSEDGEMDEDDEEICPTHHHDFALQQEEDAHSPIQGRTTYSQDRAGSAIPMTPNHLNNTLPPGTNTTTTAIASTPLGLVHHHHYASDPRSLSRVSSIAPTRTTSPINGDNGVGRSISPHHMGGSVSRSASSVGGGGGEGGCNAIVAGATTARPNVMSMGGGKSWESGTVYMMSDVEHYGAQQQHRHQKPSSKTVISTVHIHHQNPHNAPRLESTSRSNSAVSRVASLSPAPCQPYTTTSISRRGSTTSNGAMMPTFSNGSAISRTSSIALERQVDIPPNVQVHSLKSVSARVHPNTLLVTSRPPSSAAAPTPATTPAKKPMKKVKKSTKKSTKSSTTKRHAEAEATVAPAPAPTTPSFFQGLLDRHERVKTDLALKGGVHRVRKSSMTTVSPTPCPTSSNAGFASAPKPLSSAASRVASVSPVPLLPASASSTHPVQQPQVIPTHHAEVVSNPQGDGDSLADAVRRHLLLYAPRPIPIPVTEQSQAGLAHCISSRRSSSIVTDIHARCSSKGPQRRSGTPQGSQPTSRSSSAAAAVSAAAPRHALAPSTFIDTMAPVNVVKEVHHTESPQSCWSEGGVDGGMHMSRSPSCRQPDGTTPPTATPPPVEVAPAVVAVHRTSSVQVRVRRPSLRQS